MKYSFYKFLYLYSGVGYVVEMIHRPKDRPYMGRKPSNFLFWIVGIYVGLFGVSNARFENRMSRLYTVFGVYNEHLNPENYQIIQALIDLKKQKVPIEPEIFRPETLFQSILPKYDTTNPLTSDISDLLSIYVPQMSIGTLRNEQFESDIKFRPLFKKTKKIQFLNSFFNSIIVNLEGEYSLEELSKQDISLSGCNVNSLEIVGNIFRSSRNFTLTLKETSTREVKITDLSMVSSNDVHSFSGYIGDLGQTSHFVVSNGYLKLTDILTKRNKKYSSIDTITVLNSNLYDPNSKLQYRLPVGENWPDVLQVENSILENYFLTHNQFELRNSILAYCNIYFQSVIDWQSFKEEYCDPSGSNNGFYNCNAIILESNQSWPIHNWDGKTKIELQSSGYAAPQGPKTDKMEKFVRKNTRSICSDLALN